MEKKVDGNNRFLKYYREGQKVKLASLIFLVLFMLGLFVEVCLAVAFVSREQILGKATYPLFERYYVLMPFKGFAHGKEPLPEAFNQNYIGSAEPVLDTILAYTPDPLIDHRLRPDVTWSPTQGSTVTTNTQGFAATYLDLRKFKYEPDPATFRIIFLGGSTVEGWGAKNSMYSLPSIFKKQIEQRFAPGKVNKNRFEVINAGVSDYDSRNEYLYYVNELVNYNPDLVISYNGGNDSMHMASTDDRQPEYLETAGHLMNKQILEDSYSVSHLLLRALHISAQETVFFFKRIFITDIFFKVAEIVSYRVAQLETPRETDKFKAINSAARIYLANMMRLKREMEASGTQFAWFMQPNLFLTDYQPREYLTGYLKENDAISRTVLEEFYSSVDKALKKQASTHDKSPLFCAANVGDALNGAQEEVYLDQVHLNEAGNRIVVERLLQELEACGFIKKVAKPD